MKKSSLSRSASQSSFHSCNEDNEDEDNKDEEYTWRTPSVVIHNILFGHLWGEFQGQIDVEHTQSQQRAVLIIKSHSWFASQATKIADMFKFNGFIYDGKDILQKNLLNRSIYSLGNDKLSAFHGNYGHCYYAIDDMNDVDLKTSSCCSIGGHNCIHLSSNSFISPACDLILTPSSRLIWHRSFPLLSDEELKLRSEYYFFTPFTMCLNEQGDSLLLLPPTDCRFRQDIRYLEEGNLEAASTEKHRLEEQQRAEARNREDEFQPLWFKKNEKEEYVYTGEYEQRIFDHCPNLFSQSSRPE